MPTSDTTHDLLKAAAAWYEGHREIALLVAGSLITFIFTKFLPWLFQSGRSIGVRALGRVSSRFRRKLALGEYLNWVILQNRDLNLTGVVGAVEKPQLEQVFISVKIDSPARPSDEPAAKKTTKVRNRLVEGLRALSPLKPRVEGARPHGQAKACAPIFSPRLFPSQRLLRLRRWFDRYNVVTSLCICAGLVIVVVWPAWSAFVSHSPNSAGSAVAGVVWTGLAAAGVGMIRDREVDDFFGWAGAILLTLFGGAVLAAVGIRLLNHDGPVIVLPLSSAFSAVVILVAVRYRPRFPQTEDTRELGELLRFGEIAILGKPGSGKSTLVQFLALTFAQARAGERKLRHRGVLRHRLGAVRWVMPVPIPLRKIAAFVESADPNVVGNLIIEAFRRNVLPSGLRDRCDTSFFLRMIAARRCLILFDGLDEVSDDRQFQALTREIVGLISQYSGNKFLITSRYAGWRGGVGTSVETFDVEDLSHEQSARFIKSWYAAIEENRAPQLKRRDTHVEREYRSARAMERASDLEQALSRSPSLRALAANPLLLSIICFVHSQKALPEERLSLYKECSNLLLGQWDREKGIPVDDTKLTLARKEAIMQQIAIALHSGRIGAQFGRKEATRQEMLPIVGQLLETFGLRDADPDSLFEKLVNRSGVIVAVERYSERYAFSHLTFQEFYAAGYLFANHLDPFDATGVTSEGTSFGMTNWWSEVIALFGAMKRQSSDIVARLIDSSSEDCYGRRLRLAAQCMVESIEIDRQVSDRLLRRLYEVRFGTEPEAASVPDFQRYLLRFASQPQFFDRYGNWLCRLATDSATAGGVLRIECEGLRVHDAAIQSAALRGIGRIWQQWRIRVPEFEGSERESDRLATVMQLSSPAEPRGTDVEHRHPLGKRR